METPASTTAMLREAATSPSSARSGSSIRRPGLNLDGDLAKVNGFPRVAASPYALEWWNQPGRTAKGLPKIPLLRMHEVGDQQVPLSLVEGYRDLIQANGKADLLSPASS